MKLVELIWLGQQIAAVGRRQLQVDAPGVPMAELVVMYDLIDHAPSAITGITQRTGYAQSRVSAAVVNLVERGWVQTAADPADGRRTIVVIPEQSRALYRTVQKAAEERLTDALLPGVADDRRPELMGALEEMLQLLREQQQPGDDPDDFRPRGPRP